MADLKEEIEELIAQAKQVEIALTEALDDLAGKAKEVGTEASARVSAAGDQLRAKAAELRGQLEGLRR